MSPPAPAAVAMTGITKRYRHGGGIENVTLEVQAGEVLALLGPNGAGKTTTTRLLLDLIRPDSGHLRVLGLDPRRDGVALRRRIGYLPGDLALYDRLTGRELLTHFAHLRGGPPWPAIGELVDRFALEVDRPLRELSKGNRQKVGLVQALMGRPDLLVLDEPTAGLDPLVQHEVHEAVRETAGEGRSVLLSSHVLSEVSRVADRVAMMRDGRLLAVERVEDVGGGAVHVVEARFADPVRPESLAALPGVVLRRTWGHGVRLDVAGDLNPVVRALATHDLVDLSVRERDLEELFLELYARGHDVAVQGGRDAGAGAGRAQQERPAP